MATYENEHATVITKDDGIRYQLATFRDVQGDVEAISMGSLTVKELLRTIKHLSEAVVEIGVKSAFEEFGDDNMLIAALGAYGVKKRLVRMVLDHVARGCGLDPEDVTVTWPI